METRLETILNQVRSLPEEFMGRREIERIFQVSRVTALKLLDRLGAALTGRSLVILKRHLIERIERLQTNPEFSLVRERQAATVAHVSEDRLAELLGVAAQLIGAIVPIYEARKL